MFSKPGRSSNWAALILLISPSISLVSCGAVRPVAQPILFSHRQHVEKKLTCTFCHSGAEKYSLATIPSVEFCMSCHSFVKADSAEVLKVKAYLARREEIPWRRIYRLPPEADVFFNHHRHAAAGVKCMECHGDVAAREDLKAEVKLDMAFCVRCHRANSARFRKVRLADDCATCHR